MAYITPANLPAAMEEKLPKLIRVHDIDAALVADLIFDRHVDGVKVLERLKLHAENYARPDIPDWAVWRRMPPHSRVASCLVASGAFDLSYSHSRRVSAVRGIGKALVEIGQRANGSDLEPWTS